MTSRATSGPLVVRPTVRIPSITIKSRGRSVIITYILSCCNTTERSYESSRWAGNHAPGTPPKSGINRTFLFGSDLTHSTFAELLQDAVVGDGLADHRRAKGTYLGNTRSLSPEGQCQRRARIEIGRIGGIQSALPLTFGTLFAATLGVCFKLLCLSLFLEKGPHFFQPQAFRERVTAGSASNDCFWPQ